MILTEITKNVFEILKADNNESVFTNMQCKNHFWSVAMSIGSSIRHDYLKNNHDTIKTIIYGQNIGEAVNLRPYI